MNTHADKTQENKSQAVSALDSQMQSGGEATFQFVDNRPEAVAQRKLQEMANNSPQAQQVAQLQAMADNYSAQQQQPIQKKENNTGLPDNLKTGMENLSGMSLDDVKVHRNSNKPAQLQAHAYAQGTDIHLGPGQEKHLPHEAWHVVQQKEGRVKPTMQMKGKVNVNDDAGLEKEADAMGEKALLLNSNHQQKMSHEPHNVDLKKGVVQAKLQDDNGKLISLEELKIKLNEKPLRETDYLAKLNQKLVKKEHIHKVKDKQKAELNEAIRKPKKREKEQGSRKDTTKEVKANLKEALAPNEKELYSDLEEAISEKNPMFFTFQNILDYLDDKDVPGLTALGKSGIEDQSSIPLPVKAGTEEQWGNDEWNDLEDNVDEGSVENSKEKERAKTIADSLKRMVEFKDAQKERENSSALDTAINKNDTDESAHEEIRILQQEFAKSTFYYGTTGHWTNMWNLFMAKVAKYKQKRLGTGVGSYNSGVRNTAFLAHQNKQDPESSAQMMDMYYGGQQFEAWHMLRNPIIGKYVHNMMGYAGDYDQTESPDSTFRKNYPLGGRAKDEKGQDAWENQGHSPMSKPKAGKIVGVPEEWKEDMSGTMEISRVIRDSIYKFGGTIVLECAGVYSQGTFVSGARMGDTNVEAKAMLPIFAGQGGTVPHGKGHYKFHWHGKHITPTRALFLSHWVYGEDKVGKEYKEKGVVISSAGIEKPDPIFWRFEKGGEEFSATEKDYLKAMEKKANA